ncbi:MAG: lipoate--protein ligase family protein [Gammaproteobacteria bacterium]
MSRTGWDDYEWRLIHEGPQHPLLHMALDDALMDEVAAGRRAPTLRFWEWASSCIVIGRFQSLRNEVDSEAAHRYGIEVVRRISGGGAMFIEPGNTITYSLYAPAAIVDGMSFRESYAFMDNWVIAALGDLGIEAWYKPLNDITSPGGKIGGAAQVRRRGAVLHHVTMAYNMDAAKMTEVLRIGKEKLSDKGTISAAKRVDPLYSQTGLSREAITSSMIATFRNLHALTDDSVRQDEMDKARELVENKFATREWKTIVP